MLIVMKAHATQENVRQVCERIVDHEGQAFTDVSAWYWAAIFNQSRGPWLVTTVASGGGE